MRELLQALKHRIEAVTICPALLALAAHHLAAVTPAERSDLAVRRAVGQAATTSSDENFFEGGIRGCAIETRLCCALAIIPGGRVETLLDFPILLDATARCTLRIHEMTGVASFDRAEFKQILIELALNLP